MIKAILSYSLALFASNLVSGGISFIVTLYAASVVSKEIFGEFNHYILIYSLLSSLILAGTQQSVISFINLNESENKYLFIRLLNSISMICLLIVVIIEIFFNNYLSIEVKFSLLIFIPNIYFMLMALVFRANLEVKKEVTLRMSISLLNSLLTLTFLMFWQTKFSLVFADMVSIIFPTMVLLIIVFISTRNEDGSFFISPLDNRLIDFWKQTFPLWIGGVAFFANSQIDKIGVDYFLGVEHLATLSFVLIFWMLLQRPVEMIQRSILPVLTKNKGTLDGEKKIIGLCILVFPLLGLVVCSSYETILAVGGYSQYKDTLKYLIILCICLPIISIEFILSSISVAYGYFNLNKNSMLICVLVNIPLSLFLVYKFSLSGAFLSITIYNFIYLSILLYMMRISFKDQVSLAFSSIIRCLIIYLPCLVFISLVGHPLYTYISCLFFIIGTYTLKLWDVSTFFDLLHEMKE